jgi:hypothetical protein
MPATPNWFMPQALRCLPVAETVVAVTTAADTSKSKIQTLLIGQARDFPSLELAPCIHCYEFYLEDHTVLKLLTLSFEFLEPCHHEGIQWCTGTLWWRDNGKAIAILDPKEPSGHVRGIRLGRSWLRLDHFRP